MSLIHGWIGCSYFSSSFSSSVADELLLLLFFHMCLRRCVLSLSLSLLSVSHSSLYLSVDLDHFIRTRVFIKYFVEKKKIHLSTYSSNIYNRTEYLCYKSKSLLFTFQLLNFSLNSYIDEDLLLIFCVCVCVYFFLYY